MAAVFLSCSPDTDLLTQIFPFATDNIQTGQAVSLFQAVARDVVEIGRPGRSLWRRSRMPWRSRRVLLEIHFLHLADMSKTVSMNGPLLLDAVAYTIAVERGGKASVRVPHWRMTIQSATWIPHHGGWHQSRIRVCASQGNPLELAPPPCLEAVSTVLPPAVILSLRLVQQPATAEETHCQQSAPA